MDYLRQGIHLRAYAQKNPKQEYKREAFELFGALLDRIKHDTISLLSRLQVRSEAEIEAQERERERQLARRSCSCSMRRRSRRSPATAGRSGPRPRPGPADRRRPVRGASARVPRRWRPWCATAARSDATSRARAARARSTSTATAQLAARIVTTLEVVAGALFDAPAACSSRSGPPARRWPGAGNSRAASCTMASRRTTASCASCARSSGVEVHAAARLIRYPHEYPDRVVWLDMWIVQRWSGEPHGLDGQALKWVEAARLHEEDILEADPPIVAALMSARSPARRERSAQAGEVADGG